MVVVKWTVEGGESLRYSMEGMYEPDWHYKIQTIQSLLGQRLSEFETDLTGLPHALPTPGSQANIQFPQRGFFVFRESF